MLINPKGSPFYIFRYFATFFERKKIQKFQVFFKRFLSVRYSANFRRSRLVFSEEIILLGLWFFFSDADVFKSFGIRVIFDEFLERE